MTTKNTDLNALAKSVVNTDTGSIRDDVARLGGIRQAAEYSADISIGQPDWEALATPDGINALEVAIKSLVE
jgi:hypothetical protein